MTTNLVYAKQETATTFRGSGGDVTWTPQNIALNTGRISAAWDRGATAVPARYIWRCSTRWAATPSAGNGLRLYLVTSNAASTPALTDGYHTFGDATLTDESMLYYNCRPLGVVIAKATDQPYCSSGLVYLFERYIAVVGWNGSATKALTNTESDHILTFTPVSDDIQAAA